MPVRRPVPRGRRRRAPAHRPGRPSESNDHQPDLRGRLVRLLRELARRGVAGPIRSGGVRARGARTRPATPACWCRAGRRWRRVHVAAEFRHAWTPLVSVDESGRRAGRRAGVGVGERVACGTGRVALEEVGAWRSEGPSARASSSCLQCRPIVRAAGRCARASLRAGDSLVPVCSNVNVSDCISQFDRGARDLAVALGGVAVAGQENSAPSTSIGRQSVGPAVTSSRAVEVAAAGCGAGWWSAGRGRRAATPMTPRNGRSGTLAAVLV